MKKLLSVVLAVAVLATMAFSMMASTASAEDVTYSLLPKTADKFVCEAAGDGTVTVTQEGTSYKFVATAGWPTATFVELDEATQTSWVNTKFDSGSTLNYDFEVVSGKAAIIVYFCGQNPKDMASPGSFVSINGLVNKAYIDPLTGDAKEDIPVGKYKASVDVKDLGYADNLKGDNGEMKITGVKIFAVGGEVIVNDISVTEKSGADNSKHANKLSGNPDNPVVTTGAQSDATTTTAAKTTAKAGTDSAKTGDTSNAILFIAVAAVAAGAVVVTAKKQKAR